MDNYTVLQEILEVLNYAIISGIIYAVLDRIKGRKYLPKTK